MIRKFVRLSAPERTLLIRLAVLLAGIRVALWAMPLARLRRLLAHRWLGAWFPVWLVRPPAARLAWAVQAASRRVPFATCLTQSLALQFLLARSGQASAVRIGVAKTPEREFKAHAWVDCEGQILLDRAEDVAGYTVLLSLEAA